MPDIPMGEMMDFARDAADMTFVAAVALKRTQSRLVKQEGYEEFELNQMPAVTWWYYMVSMLPTRLVAGEWELKRSIMVKCRNYLGSSKDQNWAAIIVADKKGKRYWLRDWCIRDGKVIAMGGKETVLGPETELGLIVRDFRKANGLLENVASDAASSAAAGRTPK